ncbi:MAG TPA: acyl-CoA thioesterase/BAAT N-terminal domain-containing protein, partial [Anaerolineae bacterium]|nr:acyl-CoA thioesterase/BAAT N-terminal domain-containing protein [Anaerolineae bacterium]
MKLHVQPLVALCDEKVSISISELPPASKVKLSASLRLPWAKDVVFESLAWFTADALGRVDLSRQKPDSGSY